MTDSNNTQTSFLGGEWGPYAQGRAELPGYVTALSASLNGMPVEEGAWVRRSCFQFLAPTYYRQPAKLLPFLESETCGFAMEFTPLALRFVTTSSLIFDNSLAAVSSQDAGKPVTIVVDTDNTYKSGDQIMLVFGRDTAPTDTGGLFNRVMTVGNATGTSLTLYDDEDNDPVDGTGFAGTVLVGAQVLRIVALTTPYKRVDLSALRVVQAETQAVVLHGGYAPYVAQVTAAGSAVSTAITPGSDPVFTFGKATFLDGPYLDLQGSAGGTAVPETGSVDVFTGTVTFTAASSTFATSDVGRHIRLWSQPPAFDPAVTYNVGDLATYQGAFWQSQISPNLNNTPGNPAPLIGGIATVAWVPAAQAGQWAWGTISAVGTGGNFHIAKVALQPIPDLLGISTLPSANGTTITYWQLGVFTAGAYPTCGCYHEGRVWLAGGVPNRFDAGMSNSLNPFNGGQFAFSPSDAYGNVADNHGISYTLNLEDLNSIRWMTPDSEGILCGTLGGEVLISASALNDPLTPTSIQAHRATRYGSANVEPRRAGLAIIFVQKFGRRVMEYINEVFTSRPAGRHLNEYAKHLTGAGVAELYYQEEPVPIVWALTNDAHLLGCTYRRFSHFLTEPPVAAGWHRHAHGEPGRGFMSMCMVPDPTGLLDRLIVATYLTDGQLEVMVPTTEPGGANG